VTPAQIRNVTLLRTIFRDLPEHMLLLAIAVYRRAISPLSTPSCRFVPSCSAYAEEAVARFGPWRGARLAVGRLLRCHPWGPFGYDPVPETKPAHLRPGGAREANR
jgi:putative membrane protein insertion efficiency factor